MFSRGKYKLNEFTRFLHLVAVCMFILSCNKKQRSAEVERAFYFWKSVYNITPEETKMLDSLDVNTLYLKYFDVDRDENFDYAIPKATLRIDEGYKENRKIIPCVFITNNCIHRLNPAEVPGLAKNIVKLISDINSQLGKTSQEIQIDCDWTAMTANVYFSLLEKIKSELKNYSTTSSAIISATIRLYQVKYVKRTGVPPVTRGMLMAYNMGNLTDPSTSNSILETTELKKYISYLADYPLELDVALPVFEWTVLFRKNRFEGLITTLPEGILQSNYCKKLRGNQYQILTDTLVSGYKFQRGDILRVETSDAQEILSTAAAIKPQLNTSKLRLSLFHLDSLILRKYSLHELEIFYNSLN